MVLDRFFCFASRMLRIIIMWHHDHFGGNGRNHFRQVQVERKIKNIQNATWKIMVPDALWGSKKQSWPRPAGISSRNQEKTIMPWYIDLWVPKISLFWTCWCRSLERKRRHISAILTRIFDILLIKACLFRRQWAVSTTLFWLFTTRTDRSKRVLSQFVFKKEKSKLFLKIWTWSNP